MNEETCATCTHWGPRLDQENPVSGFCSVLSNQPHGRLIKAYGGTDEDDVLTSVDWVYTAEHFGCNQHARAVAECPLAP